jgi:hypothetical protein
VNVGAALETRHERVACEVTHSELVRIHAMRGSANVPLNRPASGVSGR